VLKIFSLKNAAPIDPYTLIEDDEIKSFEEDWLVALLEIKRLKFSKKKN